MLTNLVGVIDVISRFGRGLGPSLLDIEYAEQSFAAARVLLPKHAIRVRVSNKPGCKWIHGIHNESSIRSLIVAEDWTAYYEVARRMKQILRIKEDDDDTRDTWYDRNLEL